MRVSSFVPTATEWMYELGLEDSLVTVTSECDVPPRAKREKPLAVHARLAPSGSAADIDRSVRDASSPLYRIDADVLREARPDVVLTQSLCDVCAASHAQVAEAKRVLGYVPKLLEVGPSRLDLVPEDARAVARAAGAPGAGDALANRLAQRIGAVRKALAATPRPRVVTLEWTDPPMSAGHWIPDMVEAAGGHEEMGVAGAKSDRKTWGEVHDARPHVLLVMPCGMDLRASVREAERVARDFPFAQVFAFDASRYFSRSGPSVATAVEMLAHALHPTVWRDDPDPTGWQRVR